MTEDFKKIEMWIIGFIHTMNKTVSEKYNITIIPDDVILRLDNIKIVRDVVYFNIDYVFSVFDNVRWRIYYKEIEGHPSIIGSENDACTTLCYLFSEQWEKDVVYAELEGAIITAKMEALDLSKHKIIEY